MKRKKKGEEQKKFGSIFCSKLGEQQKKRFSPKFGPIFAQNQGWMKGKGEKNMVQNLTRQPQLFWAPLDPGPGTMYPLNPPPAGPGYRSKSNSPLF